MGSSGVGAAVGGIGGSAIAATAGILGNQPRNTRPDRRTTPIASQYGNILTGLGNELLSYDQLVAMGRIKPGTKSWISGNESGFSKLLGGYEQSLFNADPAMAAYSQAVSSGLQGLENGGIPGDLRRSITEELRQSQASRGILDSPIGATEEVVRLMGGEEQVRAQRLAQAQDYFRSIVAPGLNMLLPSAGDLLSGSLGVAGLNLRRGEDIISARGQYNNMSLSAAGAAAGLGSGAAGGGGGGVASGGGGGGYYQGSNAGGGLQWND